MKSTYTRHVQLLDLINPQVEIHLKTSCAWRHLYYAAMPKCRHAGLPKYSEDRKILIFVQGNNGTNFRTFKEYLSYAPNFTKFESREQNF